MVMFRDKACQVKVTVRSWPWVDVGKVDSSLEQKVGHHQLKPCHSPAKLHVICKYTTYILYIL